MNILSNFPYVAEFPSALSHLILDRMMELTEYEPSLVGWDSSLDNAIVSDYRTSQTYYDTEGKFDKVAILLLNQVFRQTGHEYCLKQTERIQLTSYSPDQYFKSHWDHFNAKDPPEIDDRIENDRIATIILYLNDDFEGGETFFNRLNVSVKPQRGKICYFSYPIGTDVLNLEHEAKPVISGEKKILQIWIRNDEWDER